MCVISYPIKFKAYKDVKRLFLFIHGLMNRIDSLSLPPYFYRWFKCNQVTYPKKSQNSLYP